MKYQASLLTFYTYVKSSPKENFDNAVYLLINKMAKQGFTCELGYESDFYDDGLQGRPLLFVKKLSKKELAGLKQK